jgi:hypothetical protein
MATSSVLDAPGPEVVVVDTTPNRENKMDDDVNEVEPITPPSSKKRGRKVANAWQYLSERDDSHLHSNVKCRHCKRDVSTTKKRERAISHLLSCYQFKRAMADVDDGERPPWFNRKATGSKPTPSSTALLESPFSSSRSSFATQPPGMQKSMSAFTIPKLSKPSHSKIKANLSMHYYMTGTAFARVEDSYLLNAF